MTQEISSTDDTIDSRDVIARIEELESIRDDGEFTGVDNDELVLFSALMDGLKGNGEAEQWRGDWYPSGLIRDSYFTEYAQELAEDIGATPNEYGWPLMHINWRAAADDLKTDYSTVEFNGATYWYR